MALSPPGPPHAQSSFKQMHWAGWSPILPLLRRCWYGCKLCNQEPPSRPSCLGMLPRLQDRAWYNKILWDTSDCCNMYTNEFWSLVRALFGYTGETLVALPCSWRILDPLPPAWLAVPIHRCGAGHGQGKPSWLEAHAFAPCGRWSAAPGCGAERAASKPRLDREPPRPCPDPCSRAAPAPTALLQTVPRAST